VISTTEALVAVGCFAAIIFATRLFPFVLFSRRDPPKIIQFIEKHIPPAVMAILVIYSLKDIDWQHAPGGIPELAALGVVTILHLWKKNALLSISGSTAFYMIIQSLL